MNILYDNAYAKTPLSMLDNGISGNAFKVFAALYSFAYHYSTTDKPHFVCSYKELSDKTKLSRQTVYDCLDELKGSGYITLLGYSSDLGKTYGNKKGANLRCVWMINEKEAYYKESKGRKRSKKQTDKGLKNRPINEEKESKNYDTTKQESLHNNGYKTEVEQEETVTEESTADDEWLKSINCKDLSMWRPYLIAFKSRYKRIPQSNGEFLNFCDEYDKAG